VRAASLAAAAALATAQIGCIAAPFAIPPTAIDVGTGIRETDGKRDVPLDLRVGISPLRLDRSLLRRDVDVTTGFLYQYGKSLEVAGGYFGGSAFIGRSRLGEDSVLRGSIGGDIRLLTASDTHVLGRGAGIRLAGEIAGFGGDTFSSTGGDGGAFGVTYGESAIGGYLDGAFATLDRTTIWTATAGLVFRLPLIAGIAYAIVWPKK
jgi:hypothetical protein